MAETSNAKPLPFVCTGFKVTNKSCVVITTINPPTKAVMKLTATPGLDVVIVADKKTPVDSYSGINCTVLSVEDQRQTFPEFGAQLPFNHYARKNIGYLHAIRQGYDQIIETDDDNIPYDDWLIKSTRPMDVSDTHLFDVTGSKYFNIYRQFSDLNIWPRGLPLRHVLSNDSAGVITPASQPEDFFDNVSILQGLADGDPDVDAIFRLTSLLAKTEIIFKRSNAYYKLGAKQFCPGNTQNTAWLNPADFYLMYVPSYVSPRFCDILKMYIAQAFVKAKGRNLVFQGATMYQDRNPHDFFKDFQQECEMFLNIEQAVDIIEASLRAAGPHSYGPDLLLALYKQLAAENIIKDVREVELLSHWLNAVTKIQAR